VTRVLVTRHPDHDHHDHHLDHPDHDHGHGSDHHLDLGSGSGHDLAGLVEDDPDGGGGLATRLRAAAGRLPPTLGGAPSQPLEVGRTSRVVTTAQRAALVVRDGGCVFPDCQRPPSWCEAHHLRHRLHGGPTDLANLALICRAHHRAVHEGGWRLVRGPDGRLTATPPHRKPSAAA
jgi:hypothetical protein